MNIATAHIEFKLALDKVSSSSYPELLPEEVDYFLNEATARFVKQRYYKNNLFNLGFEEIQKRTEDLKGIVVTNDVASVIATGEERTYKYSLSSLTPPYLFYIRGRVLVTKSGCDPTYKSIKIVQQDDLEKLKLDPFNKTSVLEPLAYFEDGSIYVLYDTSFGLGNIRVTYLRKPTVIVYTNSSNELCELSEHTHKEIVQLAVNIAIENIESKRLVTQSEQMKTIE